MKSKIENFCAVLWTYGGLDLK